MGNLPGGFGRGGVINQPAPLGGGGSAGGSPQLKVEGTPGQHRIGERVARNNGASLARQADRG
jgi:hypothetical protein